MHTYHSSLGNQPLEEPNYKEHESNNDSLKQRYVYVYVYYCRSCKPAMTPKLLKKQGIEIRYPRISDVNNQNHISCFRKKEKDWLDAGPRIFYIYTYIRKRGNKYNKNNNSNSNLEAVSVTRHTYMDADGVNDRPL